MYTHICIHIIRTYKYIEIYKRYICIYPHVRAPEFMETPRAQPGVASRSGDHSHARSVSNGEFPLKGSFKGDIGPSKG